MYGGSEGRAWMASGACVGVEDGDDLFFSDRPDRQEAAKAICAACPVEADCLEWAMALATNMPGVWGGKTKQQRRDLRGWKTKREAAA